MLLSTISDLDLDQFLPMLCVLDQDRHISTIPSLNYDDPSYYWIFNNLDFQQWNAAKVPILRLSGLPKCNLDQVSSFIVNQERVASSTTDNFVLHFSFSSAIGQPSIISIFVHTILKQMIDCSQIHRRKSIVQVYLRSLLEVAFQKEADPTWDQRGFDEQDSPHTTLLNILDPPAIELLTALRIALAVEQRGLSLILGDLDNFELHKNDLNTGLYEFVVYLQQRLPKVKILLTNRTDDYIKKIFDRIPYIEYDQERRGSLTFLSLL